MENLSVSSVVKAASSLAPTYISEWFDKGQNSGKHSCLHDSGLRPQVYPFRLDIEFEGLGVSEPELNLQFFWLVIYIAS